MSEMLKPSIPPELHVYLTQNNFLPNHCMSGFAQYMSIDGSTAVTFGQRELEISVLTTVEMTERGTKRIWETVFRLRIPAKWIDFSFKLHDYKLLLHVLRVVICNDLKAAI